MSDLEVAVLADRRCVVGAVVQAVVGKETPLIAAAVLNRALLSEDERAEALKKNHRAQEKLAAKVFKLAIKADPSIEAESMRLAIEEEELLGGEVRS